jgi:hypothetical protein
MEREEKKKAIKMVGPTIWRGNWRPFRNGGLEGKFGGVCKMQAHLEACWS